MISKDQVLTIIKEKLEEDNVFIVDLSVSPANDIVLHIDSMQGVNISYCVDISRLIEHTFDREEENFQLIFSSPGIGLFKVLDQYKKYVGKEVLVKKSDAKPQEGLLLSVSENAFTIGFTEKIKEEGKKKKIEVQREITYRMDEVISVEPVLKF